MNIPPTNHEGVVSLSYPTNTMSHQRARPFTRRTDMSAMTCAQVSANMAKFMDDHVGPSLPSPEGDALFFYGMNHGVALISADRDPLEPLDAFEHNFVDAYHAHMVVRGLRAFYYLLWICTRESRHNQSLDVSYDMLKDKFGVSVADFFVNINGGEAEIAKAFLGSPPNASIGDYIAALRYQFDNCSWGAQFGGKKWGVIAMVLHRFVTGVYSAEMLLDTVFTLAHNTSSIFNKHTFYAKNTNHLIRLLDVQRSGQMPEAILYDDILRPFSEPALRQRMQVLVDRYPERIGKYVDWFKVEALGAVSTYPADQASQIKKRGMTPAMLKAAKEAEAEANSWFIIMPDVSVKKIQMERA